MVAFLENKMKSDKNGVSMFSVCRHMTYCIGSAIQNLWDVEMYSIDLHQKAIQQALTFIDDAIECDCPEVYEMTEEFQERLDRLKGFYGPYHVLYRAIFNLATYEFSKELHLLIKAKKILENMEEE